jgi:hypothetical protein
VGNTDLQVVKVHLTTWDLLWFNVLIFPRASWGRVSIGLYVAMGLVGGIATGGVPATFDEVLFVVLFAGVLVTVCLVGFLVFLVLFVLLSSRSPGLLGEHVFSLELDGLRETTSANDTLLRWGGVHGLHRTGGAIFIGISPMVFHVLPRRFFAWQAAFDAFWAAIQPLKRRAK